MSATLTWFVFGAFLIYVIVVDPNVYDWLVLFSKNISIQLKRQWYKVRYYPGSPWMRYIIYRNSIKLAKELQEELDQRNN